MLIAAHIGSVLAIVGGYVVVWRGWRYEHAPVGTIVNVALATTVFGCSFWLPTSLATRTQMSIVTYLWYLQALLQFLNRPRIKPTQ